MSQIKPTDVFTVEITGAVLMLLAQYHDKYDAQHSLQYTLEDCLVTGVKAYTRSKEYSEETKNSRLFKAAIAKDPLIVTRPKEFLALCRKFGVGCQPVEMTSIDLKQASEPPTPPAVEQPPAATDPAALTDAQLEAATAPTTEPAKVA